MLGGRSIECALFDVNDENYMFLTIILDLCQNSHPF